MTVKVGDAISLEGEEVAVVFCRGHIKEIIKVGKYTLATTDGVYYFHTDGCGAYKVVPRDDAEGGEEFYAPFQRIRGISFKSIDSGAFADIYIKIDDNAIQQLVKETKEAWGTIFKGSTLEPDLRAGNFTITCTEDEFSDVADLVTDKKNIFSKFPHEIHERTYLFDIGTDEDILTKYEGLEKVARYLDELVSCNFRQMPEDELVNLNNFGRRSFQWEVWAMCNNYCTYCYLGSENRHTDKERQMKSLVDLHKAIDNLDFRIYNNVSLIGGDFFQGQIDDPDVHDSFMALIEKLAIAYRDGKLGSIWITCTMTLGPQKHLYEMLDLFEKYECFPREKWNSSGLWLCTSWDIKGRFHTPDRLENWDHHMLNIQKEYPWVKFNTTIILMEPFCQAVIDGQWSPREFAKKYKTTLFFKQVGLGNIAEGCDVGGDEVSEIDKYNLMKIETNKRLGFDFCPHRRVMLEFLRKFATDYPEFYDRLYNIRYRADELHRNFNDSMVDMKTVRNKNSANETDVAMENSLNTCGHMINYMPYIDSSKCCICDKFSIWESFHGDVE